MDSIAEINFHIEDVDSPIKSATLETDWLKKCIENEGQKCGIINYIFCSDAYLHKLNVDFLSHDTLTDIITFDYSENEKLSADIFISTERVLENALLFEKVFLNELRRVMIHGILHLIGYDDKSADKRVTMRAKEDFYLTLHPAE